MILLEVLLSRKLLIGVGSRRRSASQAIDLPSDGGVNVRRRFTDDNETWLRNGRRNAPRRIGAEIISWEIPKAWFNDFVDRALQRYGEVWVIQPFRAHEKCAPACRTARSHECECSCKGKHHGTENAENWFDVSEASSFRWNNRELACRLLIGYPRLSAGRRPYHSAIC